jgi:hypothetical protein
MLVKMNKVVSTARSGQLSKATQLLLSNDSFVDCNDPQIQVKVASLFQEHPYEDTTERQANSPEPQQVQIQPDDIAKVLVKMPRSAAGPSGWTVSATRALCSPNTGKDRMSRVLTAILMGDVPPALLKALTKGNLTILSKPDGGIRPIIAREVWLRLLAKTIAAREQPRLANTLAPLQAGVGVRGGTEFVIHSVRQILHTNPEYCAIAIDSKNAYGTIARAAMQEHLTRISSESATPQLQRYFNLFIQPASTVVCGDTTITIAEGVTQGDPLSPLFFSLGIQSTLEATQQVLETNGATAARVFAYLDDVCIIGPPERVADAFTTFKNCASKIGLAVNPTKTKLLLGNNCQNAGAMTTHHSPMETTQCINLLGTPVGRPDLETEQATALVRPHAFQQVTTLPDKQTALLLLRSGISAQHNHLVRTMAPDVVEQATLKNDKLVRTSLAELLDIHPTSPPSSIWEESRLRLRHGGLGLTELHSIRHMAYFASVGATLQTWGRFLPSDHPLLASWTASISTATQDQQVQNPHQPGAVISSCITSIQKLIAASHPTGGSRQPWRRPAIPASGPEMVTYSKWPHFQQRITSLLSQQQQAEFMNKYLTLEWQRAQFLSKTGPGASAFLQAIPSDRGLSLSNEDLTLALHAWLRLPVLPRFDTQDDEILCNCARGTAPGHFDGQKLSELHLLNCQANGILTLRHSSLVAVFSQMFTAAELKPVLEPLAGSYHNTRFRYDLAVDRADQWGQDVRIDVSIRNPLAKKLLTQSSKHRLYAAERGADQKRKHYAQFITNQQVKFIPAIMETFGALHPDTTDLIATLSSRVNNFPPEHATFAAPTFAAYWTQRISVCLQRENSRLMRTVINRSLSESHWQAEEYTFAFDNLDDVNEELPSLTAQDQMETLPNPALHNNLEQHH